ncbi:hypothetical protein ACWEBX_16855 [Streptomyces sp. NPDC005070]
MKTTLASRITKPRSRTRLSSFLLGLGSTCDVAGLGTYTAMSRVQVGSVRMGQEHDWLAVGRDLRKVMADDRIILTVTRQSPRVTEKSEQAVVEVLRRVKARQKAQVGRRVLVGRKMQKVDFRKVVTRDRIDPAP